MAKKLRVGIVGVGGISNTHLPGWEASPDAELVAGSDIDGTVLKKWSDRTGIKKIATDPDELFSDPDIDIIDVCTPNNYHAPLAIAALSAGKHVICEKPLAPKPDAIHDMIKARDKSGRLLMTAQHFRFTNTAKAMKAELDRGVLGDIYHARSWQLRRCAGSTRPGFVMKAHSGGGPCIDIGVHILDLTLWFMGHPKPVAVSGVADARLAHLPGQFLGGESIPKEWDIEDYAAAFVRFAGGITLILEVSWLLHHDTAGEDIQMWLYGTNSGCHWPKMEFYETNRPARQFYNRTLKLTPRVLEAHAQECVEFADAIAKGKPSPVPPEESLQVMTILDGIYRSQEAKREVEL